MWQRPGQDQRQGDCDYSGKGTGHPVPFVDSTNLLTEVERNPPVGDSNDGYLMGLYED
jgi:hypothetical protein